MRVGFILVNLDYHVIFKTNYYIYVTALTFINEWIYSWYSHIFTQNFPIIALKWEAYMILKTNNINSNPIKTIDISWRILFSWNVASLLRSHDLWYFYINIHVFIVAYRNMISKSFYLNMFETIDLYISSCYCVCGSESLSSHSNNGFQHIVNTLNTHIKYVSRIIVYIP